MSWGLAEDAGKSARWLAAHGLPGPGLLDGLLQLHETKGQAALTPEREGKIWRAEFGICPLMMGAAMSDFALEEADMQAVLCPALMLMQLSAASARAGKPLTLHWNSVSITALDEGLRVSGKEGDLVADIGAPAILRQGEAEAESTPFSSASRAEVDAAVWSRLADLAHRTYAPATEASRIAGAGAGLTDND